MPRLIAVTCMSAGLLACASSSSVPAEAPRLASDTKAPDTSDGWTSTHASRNASGAVYDDGGRPLAGSSVTLKETPRFESQTIGDATPPPPPRPRRVGKRDVFLRAARLDNTLRLLAREGRFNLVVQDNMPEPVTLELRSVEPYDALLAVAEANRLSMRYRDGIVIVTRTAQK